ncbi:Gfo/Idh/MocA family protein [Catenuloplanes indicus]|uniref:Dehydrogenase n=1 Tax=Catenuloplanes indicus TaxID=137267 RepID=A0AAE3W9V2_9ACTN|nr:Gfo/Idh/MocA family oxidoreductase [Catenuloplanes indicus]MDQ0371309.1 putative dehydrogenase [Catenuloplanes indicus]
MSPVTIALVGAGSRGQKYAEWVAAHPDRACLVAVADPLPHRRERAGGTPYPRWEDLIGEGRVADAVIIATQDRDHLGPAEAFARAGYHVLLEKPLAPAADECRRIVATVADAGVLLAVCHVLRYTPCTDLVKRTSGPARPSHWRATSRSSRPSRPGAPARWSRCRPGERHLRRADRAAAAARHAVEPPVETRARDDQRTLRPIGERAHA